MEQGLNSSLGKWATLGPKMVCPHNSESAIRFFLKFCTVKGANRYMKVWFLPENFCSGQMGHFGSKNDSTS